MTVSSSSTIASLVDVDPALTTRIDARRGHQAGPRPVAHARDVVAGGTGPRAGFVALTRASGSAPRPRASSARPGTRSITSTTRRKRSRSLSMTMSNGVVVVPSSRYPCTWKLSWLRALVRELVDERRIAVVGEDHRRTGREQPVEVVVGQPVRVLGRRHQSHQVDDVHHASRGATGGARAASRRPRASRAWGRRRRTRAPRRPRRPRWSTPTPTCRSRARSAGAPRPS